MKRLAAIIFTLYNITCACAQGTAALETATNFPVVGQAAADSRPWGERVAARLDSLLGDPLFSTTQVGLMVWDLSADSLIYARSHRQRMRPASTLKVVTAVTALSELGASHSVTTSLLARGERRGRSLYGDLVCVGGMDPLLGKADLVDLARKVKQAGVDTIVGRVVEDLTMKDTLRLGEGWCWDDKNPVLSPLLVDRCPLFACSLAAELSRQGVVVKDEGLSVADTLSAVVAEQRHSLADILRPMMKESDNLCAESVFYILASHENPYRCTASDARFAEQRLISRLGLDTSDYRIADGSGLSLYTYVSAELLVTMLRHAWTDADLRRAFMPTMPIAGVDGTLKRRMLGTLAVGNVRAKTGTVSAVSSLAGYLTAPNGHELCFAIINQGVRTASEGRTFQDSVCVMLADGN